MFYFVLWEMRDDEKASRTLSFLCLEPGESWLLHYNFVGLFCDPFRSIKGKMKDKGKGCWIFYIICTIKGMLEFPETMWMLSMISVNV